MVRITKLVLDILKPHRPNAMEFARVIAGVGEGYHVYLTVIEVDEKTETLRLEISAESIEFDVVETAVKSMGATVHSIDEVGASSLPQQI